MLTASTQEVATVFQAGFVAGFLVAFLLATSAIKALLDRGWRDNDED
jgi:hypothetical protein